MFHGGGLDCPSHLVAHGTDGIPWDVHKSLMVDLESPVSLSHGTDGIPWEDPMGYVHMSHDGGLGIPLSIPSNSSSLLS